MFIYSFGLKFSMTASMFLFVNVANKGILSLLPYEIKYIMIELM